MRYRMYQRQRSSPTRHAESVGGNIPPIPRRAPPRFLLPDNCLCASNRVLQRFHNISMRRTQPHAIVHQSAKTAKMRVSPTKFTSSGKGALASTVGVERTKCRREEYGYHFRRRGTVVDYLRANATRGKQQKNAEICLSD